MPTRTRRVPVAIASVALLSLVACGSGTSATQHSASITQQSALTTQTITFAISGLGSEGQYTEAQVSKFEKLHPNVHVAVEVLSSDSTVFLSQVDTAFAAGSRLPTWSSPTSPTRPGGPRRATSSRSAARVASSTRG